MSKLKVSEIFYSAQGEGRFVGVPSLFLRTFGCNFTCSSFGMSRGTVSQEADEVAKTVSIYNRYEDLPLVNTGCDSYASWHPKFKHLSPTLETAAVVDRMLDLIPEGTWQLSNGNNTHLVITGGEPLLGWQRAYPDLLDNPEMRTLKNITFETNGTQMLSDEFQQYLFQWQRVDGREVTFSVSAKLSASGEAWDEAVKPEVVKHYETVGTVVFKFVVENPSDFDEVDRAVQIYRDAGIKGVVYVMPVGGVVSVYDGNKFNIADEAMLRGYYYSPRLHVDLWGNSWGK
jgi:organic radical activating enzyme